MLAVIADDLTGAAEIGGIGLSYGLKVEISSKVNPSTEADLLVIATDTRSKNGNRGCCRDGKSEQAGSTIKSAIYLQEGRFGFAWLRACRNFCAT